MYLNHCTIIFYTLSLIRPLLIHALPQPLPTPFPQAAPQTQPNPDSSQILSHTPQGYAVLSSPPCSTPYDNTQPSFFQPNSIKPNICFQRNPNLQFDLKCNQTPVNGTLFNRTLSAFQQRFANVAEQSSFFNGRDPALQSLCVGPDENVVPSSEGTVTLTLPGPCVGIRLVEEGDDGAAFGEFLTFTATDMEDFLETLGQLPGVVEPLECRVDVHTAEGVRFAGGCIMGFDRAWGNENPGSCSPDIPPYEPVSGSDVTTA